MPKTTAKKVLKGIKCRSKTKAKKTVQQMSDSDSESLLGPDRPEERPEGSEHKEGEEEEETRERQAHEVTQEEADPDEEDGVPTSPSLQQPHRSPGAGPGWLFLR